MPPPRRAADRRSGRPGPERSRPVTPSTQLSAIPSNPTSLGTRAVPSPAPKARPLDSLPHSSFPLVPPPPLSANGLSRPKARNSRPSRLAPRIGVRFAGCLVAYRSRVGPVFPGHGCAATAQRPRLGEGLQPSPRARGVLSEVPSLSRSRKLSRTRPRQIM